MLPSRPEAWNTKKANKPVPSATRFSKSNGLLRLEVPIPAVSFVKSKKEAKSIPTPTPMKRAPFLSFHLPRNLSRKSPAQIANVEAINTRKEMAARLVNFKSFPNFSDVPEVSG